MKFAVSFFGNGAANAYSLSDLKGRSPTCVGLGGIVSPLLSYAEITTTGVQIAIPSGAYQISVMGFLSASANPLTVGEAVNSAGVEIYQVATASADLTSGSSHSLTETYSSLVPPNLFTECPDLSGGSQLYVTAMYPGGSGTPLGGLYFDDSDGGLPPTDADGVTAMATMSPAFWYTSPRYLLSTTPLENYYPRRDIFFNASYGGIAAYSQLVVEVAAQVYETSATPTQCGSNGLELGAGNFDLRIFRGGTVVKIWAGAPSAPGPTRTLQITGGLLRNYFTGNTSRSVGGVLISVRSLANSQVSSSCRGLKINSTSLTLIP